MKYLIPIFLLTLLVACQNAGKPFLSQYLHTGNLPQQSFTINPDTDTTLTSSGGVKIKISKGTFPSGKPVTIEWKEALDFQSILKAGLTTQTGKDILRSSGMFYFNTAEGIAIQKPIGIDVPTATIASGMQLYKGDSSEGKLDWQDPKPIENVTTLNENLYGKSLFQNNCASCHRVDRPLTASGLAGITEVRSKPWLYAVTRSTSIMRQIDPVMCCQIRKFGVTMMDFPGLSIADMDSIYAYIDYETQKQNIKGFQGFGCDNCAVTDQAYDSLLSIYNREYYLELARRDFFENDTTYKPELAAGVFEGKTYYQVNIQSEGWFNIDALFKESTGAVPSNLIVYPKGERNKEIEYYLAIPAMKILVDGTVQNGGETVVFNETNGQIPLPLQRGAFIIAVGGAVGKYFFAKKEFLTSTSMTIDLPIQKASKQELDARINELSYYGLNTQEKTTASNLGFTPVTDTNQPKIKSNRALTKIEAQLLQLTNTKRKECGCNDNILQPTPSTQKDGTTNDNVGNGKPAGFFNDSSIVYLNKP